MTLAVLAYLAAAACAVLITYGLAKVKANQN